MVLSRCTAALVFFRGFRSAALGLFFVEGLPLRAMLSQTVCWVTYLAFIDIEIGIREWRHSNGKSPEDLWSSGLVKVRQIRQPDRSPTASPARDAWRVRVPE